MNRLKHFEHYFLVIIMLFITTNLMSQDKSTYQRPPEHLASLFEAAETPIVSVNRQSTFMLLLERSGMPPISEVAQPELRLAGLRINPAINGQSRVTTYVGLLFKNLNTLEEKRVTGLPNDIAIDNVSWSPDGEKIAFTINQPNGLELWYADTKTFSAKKLTEALVNDIYGGNPYNWYANSSGMLVKMVDKNRGKAPVAPLAPEGPVIQSNTGGEAPVRTYQDLLKNAFDENLFEYYATSILTKVDLAGNQTALSAPGMYTYAQLSPDNNYMIVSYLKRPFSYIVPFNRFPMNFEVWNANGQKVYTIYEVPLTEGLPKGFDAVRTGPRSITWRADVASTLAWVEAQDGGDPNKTADFRDQIFFLPSPFNVTKIEGPKLKLRFAGFEWLNEKVALVYEGDWKTRRSVTSMYAPDNLKAGLTEIFNLNSEDAYANPGDFQSTYNAFGQPVLLTPDNGKTLYLIGMGASKDGNKPFIDEFNVATKKSKRLWQSKAPFYEIAWDIVDLKKSLAIVRRESKDQNPNFYLVDFKKGKDVKTLTSFPHPYPQLKDVKSELIHYQRADGVKLTGKLYLPAGYNKEKDGRLPVLMWAYPQEFKSADAAGQVQGSPYEFMRLSPHSPLYWVADGYAVLDDPAFPIIGEGDKEPNDTYITQLVACAEAAIKALDTMGVGDPKRVAVGGHSYGAFMTANLLTHSNLFAAGIARSGAYNRTLTPFGFQSEERTFWEAKETYNEMSPFNYAEKINTPILLIHGEADNNSGTFPIQTERYYAALKGNGKVVRYVVLPYESHGYRAKESLLHMAWEMTEWMNKYVKNKK